MNTQQVQIYTDGACSGNPGPGGWGVLLCYGEHQRSLSGGEPLTTNNRMELTAVIRSLEALKRNCDLQIYTDSTYVRDGIMRWLPQWKVRNWRTAHKRPVKNQDLWQTLEALTCNRRIEWIWVKGHAGNVGNEHADTLARAAIPR